MSVFLAGVAESPQPYGERKIEPTRLWLQTGGELGFTQSGLDHGILQIMPNKPPNKGGRPSGVFGKCVLSRFGRTGAPRGSAARVPPEAPRFSALLPCLDSCGSCQSEFLPSGSGALGNQASGGTFKWDPSPDKLQPPAPKCHRPMPVLRGRGAEFKDKGCGVLGPPVWPPRPAPRPKQHTSRITRWCCARRLGTQILKVQT